MRSAGHCTPHRWPLLLVGGVAVLCASTALASRSVPASDLRAALTTSPAASPVASPAALPAATFTLDPAAGFSVDLAADLRPSPFRPLTGDQGTVHAVADGDGVIAESYLVRPDGTVQFYGSDRTPPRLVLGRVRPLVAGQPQTLQLVFSEDVQATGTTAVALSGPGGTPHPLTLDPASGRVWTATLGLTLLPGDAFILTVSGVEDLAGNQILPQSLPFVAPEPALGLVLPGTAEADILAVLDGPTGLALVLSTPVDPGAIPAGLVSVKRAGLAVAGSVSVHTGGAQPLEGAVLMWTPTDPQAYQPGACEVTVAAGLVDLAGHPIHGPPDAIAYDHSGQGDVVWARPEDAPILTASQAGNDRFLHGRPLVATLGLYDHRARFYDPTTQTFLEPDPLGPVDSPNLYQAFGLDPQNNTDPLGLAEFLKPTTTSVAATYTTCIKSRPQGDVSVPCVDIPGGKVTVEGFTAATDTPDYLRALHRVGVSDEDAAAMVARNAPDSVPIAGTPLGAAAQRAAQAGTVAKPAFHLTMGFVQLAGAGMLASSWAMPSAYLQGLGGAGSQIFWAKEAARYQAYWEAKAAEPTFSHGTYFFGEDVLPYIDRPNATLGAPGRPHFFSPFEDVAGVRSVGEAMTESGHARSITAAYTSETPGYGVTFPTRGLSPSVPTPADAGGWGHFLEGGRTAVRTADPNGGFMLNLTREYVVPGGGPMPQGSVLFRIGQHGEWIPIRRF